MVSESTPAHLAAAKRHEKGGKIEPESDAPDNPAESAAAPAAAAPVADEPAAAEPAADEDADEAINLVDVSEEEEDDAVTL